MNIIDPEIILKTFKIGIFCGNINCRLRIASHWMHAKKQTDGRGRAFEGGFVHFPLKTFSNLVKTGFY